LVFCASRLFVHNFRGLQDVNEFFREVPGTSNISTVFLDARSTHVGLNISAICMLNMLDVFLRLMRCGALTLMNDLSDIASDIITYLPHGAESFLRS